MVKKKKMRMRNDFQVKIVILSNPYNLPPFQNRVYGNTIHGNAIV